MPSIRTEKKILNATGSSAKYVQTKTVIPMPRRTLAKYRTRPRGELNFTPYV
jgi:hypothetical protein